ncbi:MAG: glycosyltransferase family 39 protein [Bacteroidales bacterium]|nr:glycosyltransferase family 39 protein [Bacteroidales bacterium]
MKLSNKKILTSDYIIIACLAIIKILFHLINPEYGYHRDELFFLYISDNYSFSNLDVLPLTPIYLKIITGIFGTSIKAVHFASGLPGAVSLIFSCLITKDFGGKKFAILLTGLSIIFSGFLIFGAMFTYDSIDFLIVVISFYFFVKLFKQNKPKYLLAIGIAIGFGLLNKLTVLFFCGSAFLSLILVKHRKYLLSKWFYIASAVVIIFFIPFTIWQIKNNWYFIDWAKNYAGTNSYIAPLNDFIWNQILPNNFINSFIWLSGLIVILFFRKWNNYRFFGYVYLTSFVLIFLLGGKFYFLIPYYSILLAAGSVQIEELLLRLNKKIYWFVSATIVSLYILLSLISVPLLVPVLSVKNYVQYTDMLGMTQDAGVRYENNRLNDLLPQHFADRFGWEEMSKKISEIYSSMPSSTKDSIGGILCNNSGQAAALNFYREKYDLPEAISAHGWFYYHAKENHSFMNSYISIYENMEKLKNAFQNIDSLGYYTNPYCMPYETDKTIFVCSEPKIDMVEFWDNIKH